MQTGTILSTDIQQLNEFLENVSAAVHAGKSDWWVVEEVTDQLTQLVAEPSWLPEEYCKPLPGCSYSQYPLYIDPSEAFCVTAIAFGPSIITPIHNHTVWGVIGVYRGVECERRYSRMVHLDNNQEAYLVESTCCNFGPGMVSGFTAPNHDIHSIETTPFGSVSIHVYGANIVKVPRFNYDRTSGRASLIYSSFSEVAPLTV